MASISKKVELTIPNPKTRFNQNNSEHGHFLRSGRKDAARLLIFRPKFIYLRPVEKIEVPSDGTHFPNLVIKIRPLLVFSRGGVKYKIHSLRKTKC